MSEEFLANKSQPPSGMPDAEYDIIYATVSETAQGRRFLEEYARRCKPAEPETSLAAIERMQAVMRDGGTSERLQLLLEMADMAQAIVRLRAEIIAMRPPGAGGMDATEELDSIVQTTESATSRILAAAEQVQEIAWTMRESGSIEALCDELDSQATEIYTSCSFQDLTGQRTRKVVQVLRYLESRINAVVAAQGTPAPAPETSSSESLMQAGVDAVMQRHTSSPEERHEERQDATLEDISRLMLAIEPAILPPTQTEEPVEQPGANIVRDEVRPELSVAEAVVAEGESARALAEWAVEPAALAQPKPAKVAAAPMMDWVVEDRQAPQPDSEPAWMILRRLETELDDQMEAEDKAAATAPPAPAVPSKAEPVAAPSPATPAETGLFVAEAMAQLAQELRPVSLLPPPELTFRTKLPPTESLTELQTAIEAAEMKLLQPGDETAAPKPDPVDVPSPEASSLMQRAAATVIESRVDNEAAPAVAAETELDDFLFANETPAPTDAVSAPPVQTVAEEPAPQETGREEIAAAAAPEWESGTFPDPALVTPVALPPQAEADARANNDPLAPIRALSDAQKIALFS